MGLIGVIGQFNGVNFKEIIDFVEFLLQRTGRVLAESEIHVFTLSSNFTVFSTCA